MIKHYELNESRIHQVADDVIADEICQEMLMEQNAVTALPWQVSADIRKLLKSQNELLNIHDQNAREKSAHPLQGRQVDRRTARHGAVQTH